MCEAVITSVYEQIRKNNVYTLYYIKVAFAGVFYYIDV